MKLYKHGQTVTPPVVKVEYPLKQGLKHDDNSFIWIISSLVKVEYPLKQGLKPLQKYLSPSFLWVKVEYPLKQGLKPKGEIS